MWETEGHADSALHLVARLDDLKTFQYFVNYFGITKEVCKGSGQKFTGEESSEFHRC